MILKIKCQQPFEFEEDIKIVNELRLTNCAFDSECFEKLISLHRDKIEEKIIPWIEDDCYELIHSIAFVPKARYYLAECYDEYKRLLLETVKKKAKEYHVYCIFKDKKEHFLFKIYYDMEPLLKHTVSIMSDNENLEICVGEAIIRGMERYVISASWHYGMIDQSGQLVYNLDWFKELSNLNNGKNNYEDKHLQPIIWFGLEREKPEDGWILNTKEDNEATWQDFWLCDDSAQNWINSVPDACDFDPFLTWMVDECALDLPSLLDVLQTCPIQVDKDDHYHTLSQKVREIIN